MSSPAFLFAGGGSGGHIFPALAIFEELTAMTGGKAAAVFVCSDRPLDSQVLKREGVDFRVIPAKPIALRPRGLYRFARSWGPSVRAGRSLIRELRQKHGSVQVVAMGGFVAAPIARAAQAEGAPVVLINLDAVPGKANRMIARSVSDVISAAEVVGPCAGRGWPVVPPIVRPSSLTNLSPAECRARLGLDPDRKTLLVTGGSQGAVSINRTVLGVFKDRPPADWQVIHQTGKGEEESAAAVYKAAGVPAVVRAFFDRMGEAWRASDLAVSRAGAGGVADAWAYHIPTLFMPNPYHKDQHQKHNAARLLRSGAARIAQDLVEESDNSPVAGAALRELMSQSTARVAMKAALVTLGPADGAGRIARTLLKGPLARSEPYTDSLS